MNADSLTLTNSLFFPQEPTNLQGKIQKHQAFEAELNANRNRLDAVDATGQELISENHYATDVIQQRLDELHELWRYLFECSSNKGLYLLTERNRIFN